MSRLLKTRQVADAPRRPLSVREVADALGVSDATVRANAELWGGKRLGKLWKFHPDLPARLLPSVDTLPAPCPAAPPRSASPNEPPEGGASVGASTGGSGRSGGMRPASRRNRARAKSGTAFGEAFPEYARSAR